MAPEPRNKRWTDQFVIAVLLLSMGVSMYYADLITAAFATNPIRSSPESIARGRELFRKNCESCHGQEGQGDGPAASFLRKRPQDLTTLAPTPYFPDGVVAYRIANGKDVMPAWKGVLTEREIWDLINYIRSLRR